VAIAVEGAQGRQQGSAQRGRGVCRQGGQGAAQIAEQERGAGVGLVPAIEPRQQLAHQAPELALLYPPFPGKEEVGARRADGGECRLLVPACSCSTCSVSQVA
jgi:hypothetical protein